MIKRLNAKNALKMAATGVEIRDKSGGIFDRLIVQLKQCLCLNKTLIWPAYG